MKAEQHARAKEVFLRALDLPADEQSPFLEGACGSDEDLRREVESLLRYHAERTLFSETARPVAATLHASVPSRNGASRFDPLDTGRFTAALLGIGRRRLVSVIVAVLLLVVSGMWTHHRVKRAIRGMVGQHLQALLNADVLALEEWIEQRKFLARAWASDPRVRETVQELVAVAKAGQGGPGKLLTAPAQKTLRAMLNPYLQEDDAAVFLLADRSGLVVASNHLESIGEHLSGANARQIRRVMAGETRFIRPFPEDAGTLDSKAVRFGRPIAWVATPVRDEDREEGDVIALLGFGMFADERFNDILTVARMGESGETCAFDEKGLMLSESRFTEHLKRIGLVPDAEGARSMLHVQMRNPGGDLARGFQPRWEVDERPLTLSAALAIASRKKTEAEKQRGILVDAYRDYRGVSTIGAWRWLAEYDLGMATKVDVAEADAPLVYLEAVLAVLVVLFAVSVALVLLSSFSVVRLRKQVDEAIQMGQYQLDTLIGEGGMGRVYLAWHAMLRRPTAVKVIKSELTNSNSIARFEREVQLASRLTHPNTIEIYDYGRTADGVFYYAMEYLPGINLADLIARGGAIPAGRLVHILKQACGSLSEAHSKGLAHRDIKPQNITLCERGGIYDVVKVLDFGLVVDVNQPISTRLTSRMQIVGTPMFMAPEQLRDPRRVDLRSDIYSLGSVAYNLLTGEPPYASSSTRLEVIEAVLNEDPAPPSDVVEAPVSVALERIVMRCLQKEMDERFQTAVELLADLEALSDVPEWTHVDATSWWKSYADE
ncbi:MAG: serine/threonine protein kinase [Pirellulaceae bacterium]